MEEGTLTNLQNLAKSLEKYQKAIDMVVNIEKYILIYNNIYEELLSRVKVLLPYSTVPIYEGFKYLGFTLKPNSCAFQVWTWLYKKIEARIFNWKNCYPSRGGHLVLLKAVLQSIPVTPRF